jgi:preprotein translocase subunit SecD
MDRAWQVKTGVVIILAVLAFGALIPTIFDPGKDAQGKELPKPEWLTKYEGKWANKVGLGLDLQGGLLLQYRVEVDKAVSDKADRMAEDIQTRLKGADPAVQLKTEREGAAAIFLTFTDPGKAALVDGTFMGHFPTLVKQDLGAGKLKLEIHPDYVESTKDYAIEQAIGTIRERIDALGVSEPDIKKSGASDIVVQLPGLGEADFERTKRLIGTTAQLEFKLVDEEGGATFFGGLSSSLPPDVKLSLENGQQTLTAKTKDALKTFFAEPGRVPEGKQVVFEEVTFYKDKAKTQRDDERSYWRCTLLHKKTELTGEYIDSAQISTDPRTQKPYVALNFDATGADTFGRLTTENVGKRFAIVMDDILKSDPVINEPIPGGRAQISLGGYKSYEEIFQEAKDLVIVLRHGALPAPIQKQFETSVGPSLGADSVDRGKWGLLVSLLSVAGFMFFYYRAAGLIANAALLLNVAFIFAGMASLNATLTLPGIAGIALTIGMAVDANVIIFERIKEELRLGKTPLAAVEAGYDRAISAVLDANITTAIAGLILMQYGTGPIRGFAVTLLLGLVSTVFTAVVVTRLFYDFINTRLKPSRLSI